MNVTKPYKSIRFGDVDGPKPCEFIGSGSSCFATTGSSTELGLANLDPALGPFRARAGPRPNQDPALGHGEVTKAPATTSRF